MAEVGRGAGPAGPLTGASSAACYHARRLAFRSKAGGQNRNRLKRIAMGFHFAELSGVERRWYARDRYPNRALFWSMPRKETGCPEQFLAASRDRGICLSASQPLEPGRGLLLQLRGPAAGCTTT